MTNHPNRARGYHVVYQYRDGVRFATLAPRRGTAQGRTPGDTFGRMVNDRRQTTQWFSTLAEARAELAKLDAAGVSTFDETLGQ